MKTIRNIMLLWLVTAVSIVLLIVSLHICRPFLEAHGYKGVVEEIEPQLGLIIGSTFSAAFLAMVNLLPGETKPSPGKEPAIPNPQVSIPTEEYRGLIDEVAHWRAYGKKAEEWMKISEQSRAQLDRRQKMLRTSLFGIMVLSLILCLFSIHAPPAPPISSPELTPIAGDHSRAEHNNSFVFDQSSSEGGFFLAHLAWLQFAFIISGFGLGAYISIVRIDTSAADALRYSFTVASVLGISTTLISFPYIFDSTPVWYILFGLRLRSVVWLMYARMIAGPIICAICGAVGFALVEPIKAKLLSPFYQLWDRVQTIRMFSRSLEP